MQTLKEKNKIESTILSNVSKNKSENYRITDVTFGESRFIDLRIFFKGKHEGDWYPTKKGVRISRGFVSEVVSALLSAKEAESPGLREDKKINSKLICQIEISEEEVYRISKVRGKNSGFVDLRYFFKGRRGNFIPVKSKGIAILDTCLDEVIQALLTI